jgi:valyl-tRNA synthetase
MSEIAKAYEPATVENRWYTTWLERKAFAGGAQPERDPYCIMIPPPNVTGMLHMGHILNNTLQDIFVRRARQEGKDALWFPGTDHAGIATQTRVERKLRERGQHRRDLGREAFLDEVWKWRDEHGGIILNQLQKLGASCDWDRTSFTLDPQYSRAVLHAFVELYHRGYIYRGMRMSNWCPVSLTALSNEEVIMKPQHGLLYHMRYELVERPGSYLHIATTRPETIMGDVAVAVHPEDERYRELVGLHVWRPFPRQAIPIIADPAVDREFGSGCLKVTPAHDAVDFAIGQRHKLPVRDVFNPDGTLSDLAGEPFAGMERFAARTRAAAELESLGLLVRSEPYENNVGFSERADVPVEPRLTEQWWLRYPKVAEARRAVESGLVRFHPKRWEKTYLHWLETMERDNIDWCISRQLWWGHRIPVWYRKDVPRADLDYGNPQHVHVSVDGPADPDNWEQDEDVLDTWASSWLWPFANFGWPGDDPAQRAELARFYPTSTLVTGFDIIFLWVARMVIAGLEFMGPASQKLDDAQIAARIPFRDVYITGLIRDSRRRKMSKSLGNSPDPLDLIAKYGADGLRFGILSIAPSGQDILFAEERIEIGRNFCNKLWNACRFRQMNGPVEPGADLASIATRIAAGTPDDYDHWILGRLVETTTAVAKAFAAFDMQSYPQFLHTFFWSDYCDWYVEVAKVRLRDPERAPTVLAIQDFIVRQALLLLHPLTPFISEELWHALGFGGDDSLIHQTALPTGEQLAAALAAAGCALNSEAIRQVSDLQELVVQARALKAQYGVASRKDVNFRLLAEPAAGAWLASHQATVCSLAGMAGIALCSDAPDTMPAAVCRCGTLYLDVASAVDPAVEVPRLEKERDKLLKAIGAAEARLGNEKFLASAPPAIIEGARQQLAETRARCDEVQRLLTQLTGGAAAG